MVPVRALLLPCALLLMVQPVPAQSGTTPQPIRGDSTEQLRLFLDCASSGCDFDFLRTELTWVNYVRDRTVAQVHVISTSLDTGSGGQEVTLKFIGLKEFAGLDDEVRYTTAQGASGDEQRREFARVLKLGLARYLLRTSFGSNMTLAYQKPVGAAPTRPAHDPWNSWVFSVGANGQLSGESQSTSSSWSGDVSARRTTEQWRFEVEASGSTNSSTYELADGSHFEANSHTNFGLGFVVKSLGPHFSAGALVSGFSSTQQNVDANVQLAPTVEYDVFNYADFTRRRLVASYTLGLNRYRYHEVTVYNKTEETLTLQALALSYAARATWGDANVGVSASSYLGDVHKNRLSINGSMSVRLVKGLQLSYHASYSRVRDQVTLPKGNATDEEVLLRLRQLRTSYRASGSLSLNYTFGSVFNNVVNPRGNSTSGGSIEAVMF